MARAVVADMVRIEFVFDKLPDDVKSQVKAFVAEQVVSGKSYDEIAELLKSRFGIEVNAAQVKYFVYREFGSLAEHDNEVDECDDVDVMKELVELYRLQKGRVRKLISMEKEIGLPIPESTKNIAVALSILDKIARLKLESGLMPSEVRDRIISEILRDIEEGEQ